MGKKKMKDRRTIRKVHLKKKSDKKSKEQRIIEREQKRMKAIKRRYAIATLLLILLVALTLTYVLYSSTDTEDNGGSKEPNDDGPTDNGGENTGIDIGQTAPNFKLTDTSGNNFELKDYRGNVVILDFMAMRCNPCVQEMEELKEVRSNYQDDVRIMSIDVDDSESAENLSQFKTYHECDWLFSPGGGIVGNTYEVTYIPMIYIIDTNGIITYKNSGVTDYSILSSELDKLV